MNDQSPLRRIIAVISWHNRPELQWTLSRNSVWMRDTAGVIVSTPDDDPTELREWLRRCGVPWSVVSSGGDFNRSRLINLGVGFAPCHAPVVFILDADIVLRRADVMDMISATASDRAAVLREVRNEPADAPAAGPPGAGDPVVQAAYREVILGLRLRDGREIRVTNFRNDLASMSRLGPGIIMVPYDAFIAVGGMRSDFRSRGWEDTDFQLRLKISGLSITEAGTGIHLKHDDSVRDLAGQSRQESNIRNEQLGVRLLLSGMIQGTYTADLLAARAVVHVASYDSDQASTALEAHATGPGADRPQRAAGIDIVESAALEAHATWLDVDRPQRAAGIDIVESASGLLVHQPEPLRVHQLNNTASVILELCDGQRTVTAIAESIADVFKLETLPLAEVVACVDGLRRAGVLADRTHCPVKPVNAQFTGQAAESRRHECETDKPFADDRRIILYRFHDQFDVCRERLRLLRHFNPDVPIYGLYGGRREDWYDARQSVKDAVVHLHMWSAADPHWKWLHPELAVKEWFRAYGDALPFDLLYEYEYDMLVCAPLHELYPPLPANGLAFHAEALTESVASQWQWTTHRRFRRNYLAFCDYLAKRYGVDSIEQRILGPGQLLTRKFLTAFCQLEDCDLVHNEIAYPAFAQVLGFTLVDNRLWSEESPQWFRCRDGLVDWEAIESELRCGTHRAFHPVKYRVTLEQVISALH